MNYQGWFKMSNDLHKKLDKMKLTKNAKKKSYKNSKIICKK